MTYHYQTKGGRRFTISRPFGAKTWIIRENGRGVSAAPSLASARVPSLASARSVLSAIDESEN